MSAKLNQYIKQISQTTPNQTINVILPGGAEDLYVERGSPYDNRTIDSTTPSSKVIFHGPRDKKKIALTFDAEMTDGMKASLQSGKVKSLYDKSIIDILNKTHTKATLFFNRTLDRNLS